MYSSILIFKGHIKVMYKDKYRLDENGKPYRFECEAPLSDIKSVIESIRKELDKPNEIKHIDYKEDHLVVQSTNDRATIYILEKLKDVIK